MLPTGNQLSITAEGAQRRAARAEAIKDAWRAGETPDAAGALESNPDLAADRALAIDLAYEEFCSREESGEPLASELFCSRFPFGPSLRRLIAVHRFLDEHPAFLDAIPTRWPDLGGACGDFVIVRELGRGGFSRVYLATETTAGYRPVALKVSAAGSREADTLGPLSHPHLIPVLSSRRVGEWTIVAMPFVGTATIEDALSAVWTPRRIRTPRSAGPLLEAATRGGVPGDPDFPARPPFGVQAKRSYADGIHAIAIGLFGALAYLHDKGFAHRDLKPSNILLAPTGHPYLLDFNLASGGTDSVRVAGTLPYMAPEQLILVINPDAAPPNDWRPADIFSCGIILHELLYGCYPFGKIDESPGQTSQTERTTTLLDAQKSRVGPPYRLGVGRAVTAVIERCLSQDPKLRPTAAELESVFSAVRNRNRSWNFVVPSLASAGLLSFALYSAVVQSPKSGPIEVAADSSKTIPDDPFESGMKQYRCGNHRVAVNHFLDFGEKAQHGRSYGYAAHCLTIMKDPRFAIAAADRAIQLGYRDSSIYANRGYNHLLISALRQSKDDCDEAVNLDPANRAARLTRASVELEFHLREGRDLSPQAIEDIEFVTAGTPNSADVWMTAAHIYILAPGAGAELRDKSIDAIRNAIAMGRSPESIRRNPKLTQALVGLPAFEDALRGNPGSFDASINPHLSIPSP